MFLAPDRKPFYGGTYFPPDDRYGGQMPSFKRLLHAIIDVWQSRREDVAEQIPCGPDVKRHVDAVQQFVDAGFTHVALVQIGADHQQEFIAWANQDLLPALRDA